MTSRRSVELVEVLELVVLELVDKVDVVEACEVVLDTVCEVVEVELEEEALVCEVGASLVLVNEVDIVDEVVLEEDDPVELVVDDVLVVVVDNPLVVVVMELLVLDDDAAVENDEELLRVSDVKGGLALTERATMTPIRINTTVSAVTTGLEIPERCRCISSSPFVLV